MRQILSLVLLLSAALLSAQTSEQITVSVVEVPVYVERMGNSVAGLTKENFELFVNGSPETIEYFDVLDSSAPATDAVSVHRRRLFVLLFDTAHSPAFGVQMAKDAASKLISDSPAADTFAVATVGRAGVRFIVPFTSDRIALQRAVRTLTASAANDPFSLATLADERKLGSTARGAEAAVGNATDVFGAKPVIGAVLGDSVSGESGKSSDPAAVSAAMSSTAAGQKLDMLEVEHTDRSMIDSLGDLADRLAPLQGVKHVVLLSGGSTQTDRSSAYEVVMRMHDRYRAAGVILNAVDVVTERGSTSPRRAGIPGGPNALLHDLAIGTGGTVTASMKTLQNIQRVTYVLGFRPRDEKKRNDIKVRLRNVPWGTTVRYRSGFSSGATTPSNDGLVLADVVMNDIPQNGMTVDVAAAAGPEKVDLSATLPGRELLGHASGKPLLVDIFFYVFNDRNLVAGWSHARVSIDLEKGREFLSSNPYSIQREFALRPGRYAAKTLVHVVGTDVTGFRRTDFEVRPQ